MTSANVASSHPVSTVATSRIMIVANKTWEVDPLISVLLSERARPEELGEIEILGLPSMNPSYRGPRLRLVCNGTPVEIWCIQDLLGIHTGRGSTADKAEVLPKIFEDSTPALVVSIGTATSAAGAHQNGSVVVGSRVFLHDPPTEQQYRYAPRFAHLVSTTQLPGNFFRAIDNDVRFNAEARFLRSPLQPANPPVIIAGHNWVSVGAVNVTSYDDYSWTTPQTVAAFESIDSKTRAGRVGCIESTHGLVQEICHPAPFLFISGITADYTEFDSQNIPRTYGQSFVAAHNAAVALAWLLPSLCGRILTVLSQAIIPVTEKTEQNISGTEFKREEAKSTGTDSGLKA